MRNAISEEPIKMRRKRSWRMRCLEQPARMRTEIGGKRRVRR